MVLRTASEGGSFLLLAQDRAQPPSDEAVEEPELGWGSLLEVTEPSSKHRIEVGDNTLQAHATTAAGLAAHLVLERFQAFLAHEPTPTLEPIAEKVESLPRFSRIADPRLVRMQPQAVRRRPGRNLAQRRHCFFCRSAQDHEVVRIAHHSATALFHEQVERMQVDVSKQWRDNRPLGRSRRRGPSLHPLHDVLMQVALNQIT